MTNRKQLNRTRYWLQQIATRLHLSVGFQNQNRHLMRPNQKPTNIIDISYRSPLQELLSVHTDWGATEISSPKTLICTRWGEEMGHERRREDVAQLYSSGLLWLSFRQVHPQTFGGVFWDCLFFCINSFLFYIFPPTLFLMLHRGSSLCSPSFCHGRRWRWSPWNSRDSNWLLWSRTEPFS